ncbi:MAG TPA: hypothetical protein VHC47_03910 [Mucilaginibacter sp.]|nr:hypothetical protein [Mucilaginibacter sp.]
MKKVLSYLVSLGLAIAILVFVLRKTNHSELRNSMISGTIDKVSYIMDKHNRAKDYMLITIDGEEYKMLLTPAQPGELQFYNMAKQGDTVFEQADNDTLQLIHHGRRIPYVAKHYELH